MLYIVGTPIGNIEDTSLRAVKTLTSVEIILAEDTRTFDSFYKRIQDLFKLYPQKGQKIIHLHKENEFEKTPQVVSFLQNGQQVTLVSESGMPGFSDPGHFLINQVIKEKLPYTVVPGPTAAVNALTLSGFPAKNVLFLGFLPKKESEIRKIFENAKFTKSSFKDLVLVFYESPHRINETLKIIGEVLPESEICICREMTKKFEEIIFGRAHDLKARQFKGEITVVAKLI